MTDEIVTELSDADLDAAAGGATDNEHKDWIIIESMSSPIYRSTAGSRTSGGMEMTWKVEEGEK